MIELFGRSFDRGQLQQLVGDMSQVAGVRRAASVEGPERGADLVEIFNASGLCFSVLPGRCLDISFAHYKGMPLCFRSKTGDVGPGFYEPAQDGWLRGFSGGLLTTCGLTFVGHAETDPDEEDRELGLHGRAAYLPAASVCAGAGWEGDRYVLRVTGVMREAAMFGPSLELRREITCVLGERCLRIRDRVENLEATPAPFMLLYHTNPGFPVLDAGARFLVNSEESTEWVADAAVAPDQFAQMVPPQPTWEDIVYVHRPAADVDGTVRAALVSDRLGIGLYWKFNRAQLPLLQQWQHFQHGQYVTGIEPGNCSALGRAWNRKHGYLQHLAGGEVKEFELEIGVLDGEAEIDAMASLISPGR